VGKSSLINALADTTIVRISDKPGLTRQINFYAAGNMFNMIDMPGYGFAYIKEEERIQWRELVRHYLLVCLFFLICPLKTFSCRWRPTFQLERHLGKSL
jgi:GTP-binding protein EngB required for normal cell division